MNLLQMKAILFSAIDIADLPLEMNGLLNPTTPFVTEEPLSSEISEHHTTLDLFNSTVAEAESERAPDPMAFALPDCPGASYRPVLFS